MPEGQGSPLLDEEVEQGQPAIATLAATDFLLERMQFPDQEGQGSKVQIVVERGQGGAIRGSAGDGV
jgi:hypothetical protein